MRLVRTQKAQQRQQIALELSQIRDQIADLKKQEAELQASLLSMTGPEEVIALSPTRSLLRVDPEAKDEIDDSTLKHLVDDKTWEAITIRVLDHKALSLAIRTGVVQPGIVAEATVKKEPKASHFRAVRHDETKDSGEGKEGKTTQRKRTRALSN